MNESEEDSITTVIRFLGHNYTVNYRFTSALREETKLVQEKAGACQAAAQIIVASVVWWDMIGEDGKVLPITSEALYETPCDRLFAIYNGMIDDAKIFARSKGSPALARVQAAKDRREENRRKKGGK